MYFFQRLHTKTQAKSLGPPRRRRQHTPLGMFVSKVSIAALKGWHTKLRSPVLRRAFVRVDPVVS
jgi:hypothetical protein